MYYSIKLCANKEAYEIVLRKKVKLDLLEISKKLNEVGYKPLSENRMLLVTEKNCRVHIYSSGKLLINDSTKEGAERAAQEIYETLGLLV